MKILVDADSCPKQARDLIIRISNRKKTEAVFAANRKIPGLSGFYVKMILCNAEKDSADNYIYDLAKKGDLVVTRDLILAERLVLNDLAVIDDRGRIFTRDNIKELRSVRDFTVEMAENYLYPERKAAYGKREFKKFADSLDRLLISLLVPEKDSLPG